MGLQSLSRSRNKKGNRDGDGNGNSVKEEVEGSNRMDSWHEEIVDGGVRIIQGNMIMKGRVGHGETNRD